MTKDYQKLSQVYYDSLSQDFDRSLDGILAGFFKRYIVKHLSLIPQSRVLDVGCANGRLLAMLSDKCKIEAHGIDISPEMIKVASKRYPDYQFIAGSAYDLPYPEESMDMVVCSASFHHFDKPALFFAEAKRVLAPGGRLVIAEIRIPLVLKLYNWWIDHFSQEGDVKVYHPKELRDLVNQAGFELVVARTHWQIQYLEAKKV